MELSHQSSTSSIVVTDSPAAITGVISSSVASSAALTSGVIPPTVTNSSAVTTLLSTVPLSSASGLSSLRRSPPPSGRAEFTKPVAVVSGSRIDDVDKKNNAQSHGNASSAGFVLCLYVIMYDV